MSESQYNKNIEQLSQIMKKDGISPDEQNMSVLEKYQETAIQRFEIPQDKAEQFVYETLLYMKIKSSDGIDPLQQGDQFGAGFS